MTKCKIISRMGIGYNNIDVKEATRQGIPVAVVLDASVHEVSDHAMAFVLAFSRRLFPLVQAVRRGIWKTGSTEIIKVRGKMFRLNEQTLGLVGVGRIGSRMAPKGPGFRNAGPGVRPVPVRPGASTEGERKRWISIAFSGNRITYPSMLPLRRKPEKMFGLKEFRKMKPTAVIINTARGASWTRQALHQALVEGVIAGAGLDVCEPEPPLPGESPLPDWNRSCSPGIRLFFRKPRCPNSSRKPPRP